MRHVTSDMIDRLGAVQRVFAHGTALFGRTAHLQKAMQSCGQVTVVDRVEEESRIDDDAGFCRIATPDSPGLAPNSTNLVLAPLSLHWSNDLPGTLIQIRRALLPDGLLMAVLPGPGTLGELKQALLIAESEITGGASMRVDPFTDIRDAGALLQRAGYALPVVDKDEITVRYDTPLHLIRDLRAFGATYQQPGNQRPPLTRTVVSRMLEVYGERFSDPDGRIRATFSFVSISGWAPHESQQKPLKPGSAKSRLADALSAKEMKLKR